MEFVWDFLERKPQKIKTKIIGRCRSGAFPKGGIYDTFAGCITNQKVDSGGAFGVGGNAAGYGK